ncbi:hypothetical protein [Microbacterium rhizomatis]|uniref:Uncharacterized protein n=1 Tax=Microbacterium rhizomatis TaxID=1631477 RepID=A0A5J5J0Q2_9MICO|nr:hypothetical protein [Microbacterium rhizomatis]KAA9107564.1 hypothetical protein F6B43_08820 [Microbacterium rhizomatis]
MQQVVEALLEIFTWAGLGFGAVVAGVALVLFLLDGTWLPVRAVVETTGPQTAEPGTPVHRVVRWFDETGGVNEAPLSEAEYAQLGAHDMADIYYRRGWTNRMRLTPGSPAVRGAAQLAAGLAGVGVVSLVISWVMFFVRG